MSFKFCVTLTFLIALTKEEKIGMRSGCAGPPFSVRPEKEAKGAVLHGNSLCAKNGSIQITSTDNFLRLKNLTEGQGSARGSFLRGS